MISYETVVKLKEAGFPQKEATTGDFCSHYAVTLTGPKYCHWKESTNIDDMYVPTLSELIEACGRQKIILIGIVGSTKWRATAGALDTMIEVFGPSPEEAVAELWLVLNKK